MPNGGLDVFCRVDVGVYVKSGTVSYFVNEVERGISTCLWAKSGTAAAGPVGTTMIEPLKRWIAAENERIKSNS